MKANGMTLKNVGVIGIALALGAPFAAAAGLTVDAEVPAGNVRVLGIEGDTVRLSQDMRDTEGDWFYWGFRVKGAKGRTLSFEFDPNRNWGNNVGIRGPAVTTDGGRTWSYPCDGKTSRTAFSYTFATDDEVRFYETWQYLPPDWEAFLARHEADRGRKFVTGVLCKSRKGRDVPNARFGCIGDKPKYRILVTSRLHCSEVTATAVVEGLAAAFLADDDVGRWLAANVEMMVIPFADFDGAVDGDQGKNRRPHDHNRDFTEYLYPETRAMRDWVATYAGGWLDAYLDVHCPWIRGQYNEFVYTPRGSDYRMRTLSARFNAILEKLQSGSLNYRTADDLDWGVGWNKPGNYKAGRTSSGWAKDDVRGLRLNFTYEVPFASANGAVVTPDACRAFGRDVGKAFRAFLPTEDAALLDGWYADPQIRRFGDRYWIFPTASRPFAEQTYLDAFSSSDLKTWDRHAKILTTNEIAWARGCLWAPDACEKDGRCYLFFSANDAYPVGGKREDGEPQKEPGLSQYGGIGVAVADSPAGPYRDLIGKPLVDRFWHAAQPIDPTVFEYEGSWYMVYGGWHKCNVVRLAPDFKSLVPFEDGRLWHPLDPPDYTEGSVLFERKGVWYFMYSCGRWTDGSYGVKYGMGKTPFGPFDWKGRVLGSQEPIATGAGHHSVICKPGTDEWYICYHRRPIPNLAQHHRVTCLDRLRFNDDGTIRPVSRGISDQHCMPPDYCR